MCLLTDQVEVLEKEGAFRASTLRGVGVGNGRAVAGGVDAVVSSGYRAGTKMAASRCYLAQNPAQTHSGQ